MHKIFVLLVIMVFLSGCGGPSEEAVAEDFARIAADELGGDIEVTLKTIGTGDGDDTNVYELVTFDIRARVSAEFESGWLSNITLLEGDALFDGEVSLLYQRQGWFDKWKMTRYTLARAPRGSD